MAASALRICRCKSWNILLKASIRLLDLSQRQMWQLAHDKIAVQTERINERYACNPSASCASLLWSADSLHLLAAEMAIVIAVPAAAVAIINTRANFHQKPLNDG